MTSPSINSASSNWASAAVVPFSALSILIALNVPNVNSCFAVGMFTGSGRLRNRAWHRRLDDRQVDQCREYAEQHGKPPDRPVRSEALEHDTAQPHAEEAADLMADEGKSVQRRKPARAEHQGHQG